MIEVSRTINCFIVLALVTVCGATIGRVATAQVPGADPSAFFVRLEARRSTFYHDEPIHYGVLRRADKLASAGCNFGWGGSVQVLKNGRVIHEHRVGPVSRTAHAVFNKVDYLGFGGSTFIVNIVKPEEVDPKDAYQIRATCGEEVSEPSSPFNLSPWSAPVDGLTVLIRPLKTEFRVGEPISVEATMRNIGKSARRSPIPLADYGRARNFWRLDPYWEDPRPGVDDHLVFERGLKILQPGESHRAILSLNHFRGYSNNKVPSLGGQAGTYRVWFSVFLHRDDEDIPARYRKHLWREELSTNIITIVIK